MNRMIAIIELELLEYRASELSREFEPRRREPRARWMIVQVMTDYDFPQKDIAERLGIDHTTVHYYQNKYKPWPGETALLEKLRGGQHAT